MDLSKFIKKGLVKIKVIPNSSRNGLKEAERELKLYLKVVPEKGKANKEIIKFFKKEFGLRMEIKSGEKSRDKVLKIIS